MTEHFDRVILINRSVLTAKYGTVGFQKIQAALATMIASDKKRLLSSRIVALDNASARRVACYLTLRRTRSESIC
jgi:hypothetical protein